MGILIKHFNIQIKMLSEDFIVNQLKVRDERTSKYYGHKIH